MIKINLVNPSQAVAPGRSSFLSGLFSGSSVSSEENEIRRQGAIRLIIIGLFPAVMYAYEFQTLPQKRAQVVSKRNYLNDLRVKNTKAKSAVEETRKYRDDKQRLQKQIDTIEGLRKDRLKEVKILDIIQKEIPERVWLTNLSLGEEKLTISGLAVSDQDLSLFMEALSKSVFLKEVNLLKSSEQSYEKTTIKRFDISCLIEREK